MSGSADTERWRRLSVLFDQAIERDPAARMAWLQVECADDPALRRELEAMLAADAADAPIDAGAGALVDALLLIDANVVEEDARDDLGKHLGPWQLEHVLGRGGMGTVYAARRDDRDTHQRAAVKRLHRRWDSSLQAQRFLQERRILAALSHPHIPRLLDHGTDGDARPWFALELVEGQPITGWADARRLDLRERIELFRAVCAAVQHAHEHFVVHRDLKPGNILVDAEGHPKVLDFGVAKRIDELAGHTRLGDAAGFTPDYAAPEQISGGPVTAATDVYALGVILYRLLAGQPPLRFDEHDLQATAKAITSGTATRLDQAIALGTPHDVDQRLQQRGVDLRQFRRFVRGDLSRIVQTALAKEPPRRYASVQAFAADLQRFMQGRTVSVTGDTFGYRARTFARRNRWSVAMAVVAIIVLVAGVTGITLKTREAQAQAARANVEAHRAADQAARAEREAARAKLETARMAATNEFLRSVFSVAEAGNTGTPNISLRDALDYAAKRLDATGHADPQLHVRFLLAAASSYEALGEAEKSEAAVTQALHVQESQLPNSKEDRARVLDAMAWQRLNLEPKQALAWATEALALHLSINPPSESGLREAYSVLGNAQYANNDMAGAIDTTRKARQQMLDAGVPETDQDVIALYANEALMLAGESRYDEAIHAHQRAIALRIQSVGADTVATWNERTYFGFTLNSAGQFPQGLAQFTVARRGLQRELGNEHDNTQLATYGMGRSLLGMKQYAKAIEPLQTVHVYARTHAFEQRQDMVGFFFASALAGAQRCEDARSVIAELQRRRIALPRDKPDPLADTGCR